MELKKILVIQESDNKYCRCNICGKGDIEKDEQIAMIKTHELKFGRDNYSHCFILCDECLEEFAEKLWRYME